MAKEYKFMFDRRFDEPDEINPGTKEDLSSVSVDGIPSISQLLDTINAQAQNMTEEKEAPDEQNVHEEEVVSSEDETEEALPAQPETPPLSDNENIPLSEPTEESQAPSPIDFSYTAAEMETAQNKAREEGRLLGLEEGRESAWQEAMASIEKQNSDTLITIDASIKELLKNSQESAQIAFTTAVDLALAVCRKALPALSEANALNEIRELLEKNLHFLKDEPKISLRLNPLLADKMKPILTDLVKQEAYSGKIAVVRDDTLPAGDCRIEWKNGGLEKNIQDVLNHTEELVKLYAHTASADHNGEEHHD